MKGKAGENQRQLLPPAVFCKDLDLHGSRPWIWTAVRKISRKREQTYVKTQAHQTVKGGPRALLHQMAVCQQGVGERVSKRPQLNNFVLMPKQGHCLSELLLIISLFIM